MNDKTILSCDCSRSMAISLLFPTSMKTSELSGTPNDQVPLLSETGSAETIIGRPAAV